MSEEQQISEQLRQAREQQKKSLEEVSQQTGLSINVLRGLEVDRFDVVEPVFTCMTLRAYAEHLGLDASAIVEQYEKNFGPAVKPVEVQTGYSASPSTPDLSLPFDISTLRTIGLGGVGLILVLLIVFFFADDPVERDVVLSRSKAPVSSSKRESPPPRRQAQTTPSRTNAAEMEEELPAAPERKQTLASETSEEEREETRETIPARPAPDVGMASDAGETATDIEEAAPVAEETGPAAGEMTSDVSETTADVEEVASAAEEATPDVEEVASAAEETGLAVEVTALDSDISSSVLPESGAETTAAVRDASLEPEVTEIDASADTSIAANTAPRDAAELEPTAAEEAVPSTSLQSTARIPVAADSLLVLEVEAVDSTWVQVRWDGNRLFEGIVPRGERRSWQARDYFTVHSGRPHGLRYRFQNRLLGEGRLGDPTKHLRFRASSTGVTLLGPDLQPLEPAQIPAAPVEEPP